MADVFVRIWKVFKWICGRHLFSLIPGTIKCIYNFCIIIPRKAEEERVKKAKMEKEANAVWKSSSRLFKEIGDRLIKAEKRGVLDSQAEEVEREGSKREESVVASCPHCGQKGHEGEAWQLRFKVVHCWKKPYQGTRRQKKLGNEAVVGGKPSSSKNAE